MKADLDLLVILSDLRCSPLGLPSHSDFYSHGNSGNNQKSDREDQGKTLTGIVLAIVQCFSGDNAYKLPWLHLVLFHFCQSITLNSNADLQLNSIRMSTILIVCMAAYRHLISKFSLPLKWNIPTILDIEEEIPE